MLAGKSLWVPFVIVGSLLLTGGPVMAQATLQLDFLQVPRGQAATAMTPNLIVSHPQVGVICHFQCYEAGPFQTGEAVKNPDGTVVFTYRTKDMTCTTTSTAVGADRVRMEIDVTGPADQRKQIPYVGPCMQLRQSEAFRRRGGLEEFASRCFLYTMAGPVFVPQTGRGKLTSIAADAPNNNPPCTQWYLPYDRAHLGNIWGGVGASGDRPVANLMATVSRDGKWLTAVACRYSNTIGQLYMDCIHVVPDATRYFDPAAEKTHISVVVYVMPNDPKKLFEAYLADFPQQNEVRVAAGNALTVTPAAAAEAPLTLSVDVPGSVNPQLGAWQSDYWTVFSRTGTSARTWAYPHEDSVELVASLAADRFKADQAHPVATLTGKGWTVVNAPEGVPALVLRSPDGTLTAGLFWERSETGKPGSGVVAPHDGDPDSISVRGRLVVYKGDASGLSRRWSVAQGDWEKSVPYRLPARVAAGK